MSDWGAGLIGAVIGAALTFFGTWLTLRFNYKDLFAKTVSQNRMDWINHFREEFSIIVGTAKFFGENDCKCSQCCTKKDGEACKMILEAERARIKLLTRLNMNISKLGNEYNSVFEKKLNAINFKEGLSDDKINELIEISREILEFEWYKVKDEAKGGTNDV